MDKIIDAEILNITVFSKGFIFATKEISDLGKPVVRFYGYEDLSRSFNKIKKSTFLKIKFGYAWERIVSRIDDYISCDSAFLEDGKVFLIYPNGAINVFSKSGKNILSTNLSCRDNASCDVCVGENGTLWSTVPHDNSIINYSQNDCRILMRIGGEEKTDFNFPTAISSYGGRLYVCNRFGNRISTMSLKDFVLKDYRVFNEKVFKYININGTEFVWLESGLWSI